jgi:hypothetical protein
VQVVVVVVKIQMEQMEISSRVEMEETENHIQ